MQSCGHIATVTMSGLEEVHQMAEEIHDKSKELMDMIHEFYSLSLSLGIEIAPAAVKSEVKETDQT